KSNNGIKFFWGNSNLISYSSITTTAGLGNAVVRFVSSSSNSVTNSYINEVQGSATMGPLDITTGGAPSDYNKFILDYIYGQTSNGTNFVTGASSPRYTLFDQDILTKTGSGSIFDLAQFQFLTVSNSTMTAQTDSAS